MRRSWFHFDSGAELDLRSRRRSCHRCVGGISAGFPARENVAVRARGPTGAGFGGNNPTYPLRSASGSLFRRITARARWTGLALTSSSSPPVNSGLPSLPPVPSHASCDGGSRNTPKGFRRWSTAIISVQHFGDPERSGKKGRLAADYFSTLCLSGPLPIPSHPIPFPRLLRGLFHRPALDRPSDAG